MSVCSQPPVIKLRGDSGMWIGGGGWGVTEQQHIIAPPQVTEGEVNCRALASVCPRYRLWQVIWLAERRGRRCVQGQTLRVFSVIGEMEIVHPTHNPQSELFILIKLQREKKTHS